MNDGDENTLDRTAFALFAQWLDSDPARRRELLDAAARDAAVHARLAALIRADGAAEQIAFLEGGALVEIAADADAADQGCAGRRVGAWTLERKLGAGGMGEVWLARRSDGQHEGVAAIKMLRIAFGDAQANARFAQEGRILAQMRHPHIAMLLDAGFDADGQRYLVIEYVDGVPIDRWCDEHKLDLRGRVNLFLQVCAAVAHAHAHLVIHRDLKPSNILVLGDGEVKLLDFGIAGLVASDGGAVADAPRALTPGYAAPEQATGGALTTATDVHALGAVLYRLLCGASAFGGAKASPAQRARAVLDALAPPMSDRVDADTGAAAARRVTSPRMLRRALRGDLDAIVAKALSKVPQDRYASVRALADDLRAWLAHRVIAARGRGTLLRMRRFARRNRWPLAATAALFTVALTGAGLYVAQTRRAAREAQTTAAVKDFLFGLFEAADPMGARHGNVSARELLDRGRERVDAQARADPRLTAELRVVLGHIYGQLGLYPDAATLQRAALAAMPDAGDAGILRARAEIDYAATLRETGDVEAAAKIAAAAAARVAALPDATSADRMRAFAAQAKVEISRRDFQAARRFAEAGVAIARHERVDAALRADALWNLANADWGLKSLDGAQAGYREALRLFERIDGPRSARVGQLHGNLALVMRGRSRYDEALAEDEMALAIDEQTLGAGHPATAAVRASLGLTHYHLGNYSHARDLLAAAAQAQRDAGSAALAGTLINLGLASIELPDLDAAAGAFGESMRLWESRQGPDSPGALAARAGLGRVLTLRGQLDAAERELDAVLAGDRRRGVNDDYATAYWRGEVYRLRGDPAAAMALEAPALAAALAALGAQGRYPALGHHYLGLALRDRGDPAGAERELRAALAAFGYRPGAAHPWAASTRIELAQLVLAHPRGRVEGLRLLGEAVALRERFFGPDDARTLQSRSLLAAAAGV